MSRHSSISSTKSRHSDDPIKLFYDCNFTQGLGDRHDACPICHDVVGKDAETIEHEQCKTRFCETCLNTWAENGLELAGVATCPYCRGVIFRGEKFEMMDIVSPTLYDGPDFEAIIQDANTPVLQLLRAIYDRERSVQYRRLDWRLLQTCAPVDWTAQDQEEALGEYERREEVGADGPSARPPFEGLTAFNWHVLASLVPAVRHVGPLQLADTFENHIYDELPYYEAIRHLNPLQDHLFSVDLRNITAAVTSSTELFMEFIHLFFVQETGSRQPRVFMRASMFVAALYKFCMDTALQVTELRRRGHATSE